MKQILLYKLIFLTLIVTLSACSGKNGVNLARSRERQDISACTALLKKKKHDEAIKCFEAYKSRHFGEAGAAMADLSVADAYFAKKDYLVAAEAYQLFAETHPGSPEVGYAYFRAGLSYLKDAPKTINRDQAGMENAIKYLGAAVNYGAGAEAKVYYDQARLRLAQKNFNIGRFYYRTHEYLAAIPRFQQVLSDYPQLGLDEDSFYLLITSLKKTDQKEMALKIFDVFKNHFPESKYVKQIARTF